MPSFDRKAPTAADHEIHVQFINLWTSSQFRKALQQDTGIRCNNAWDNLMSRANARTSANIKDEVSCPNNDITHIYTLDGAVQRRRKWLCNSKIRHPGDSHPTVGFSSFPGLPGKRRQHVRDGELPTPGACCRHSVHSVKGCGRERRCRVLFAAVRAPLPTLQSFL